MNNREVFLIDLIGSYAGMDYYDFAFRNVFNNTDLELRILSNYEPHDGKPFLRNMFGKSKSHSILLMLYNYCKLFFFCLFHRKRVYVYLSFGEITDFLFFSLSLLTKNFYVDIHELFAARYQENERIKKIFGVYYRRIIKKIIFHSQKTDELLNLVGYVGNRLYVPHFKYNMNKDYNIEKVGDDVKMRFNSNNKKFLFFGNLRKVKGIDLVVDYFDKISNTDGIELVIAGKNMENINFESLRNRYGIIDRHINDDEMKYLYSHTDYVLLPYRDSSQSGILEMAFSFKKPMLLSSIPYFTMIYSNYPSFGEITDLEYYDKLLDKIINSQIIKEYYSEADCDKFMMKDETNIFVKQFINSFS